MLKLIALLSLVLAVQCQNATEEPDDKFTHIEKTAKQIAADVVSKTSNFNKIANEICDRLSDSYAKEEWLCLVGDKVQVAQKHQASSTFQFGFEVNQISVLIVVTMPE